MQEKQPGTVKHSVDFIRTTLIGGVTVLLPLAFVMLLLEETMSVVSVIAEPLAAMMPARTILGLPLAHVVAILLILLLCFIFGLLVRTRAGTGFGRVIDRKFLVRIPGYQAVKGLSRQLVSPDEEHAFAPAVVDLGNGDRAIAYVIEKTEDGYCTIMIPSAPNAISGPLRFIPADRVRELGVPVSQVFDCITYWGHGYAALINSAVDRNREGGPGTSQGPEHGDVSATA